METCKSCGAELRLQHDGMPNASLICPDERCPRSAFYESWHGKKELVRQRPRLKKYVFGGPHIKGDS